MIKKSLSLILSLALAAALAFSSFADEIASPGVTKEVHDISSGELIPESLEELMDIVEKNPALDFAEDQVLTVVVPSNLDFIIDPYELAGKGQIYSDELFFIQNYSSGDVAIKFENVKYTFVNDVNFLSLDSPPEVPFGLAHQSDLKEIYMQLQYENRDLEGFVITDKESSESAEIILEASEYDGDGNFVALNENSTLVFSFSGIVNHAPAVAWENKDVVVSIEYTMTAVTPEDENAETEDAPESSDDGAAEPVIAEINEPAGDESQTGSEASQPAGDADNPQSEQDGGGGTEEASATDESSAPDNSGTEPAEPQTGQTESEEPDKTESVSEPPASSGVEQAAD